MFKKLIALICVVLACVIGYVCVMSHSASIQNDIAMRFANALRSSDLPPSIEAEIDGRDVTLSGTVDDESLKIRAEDLALSITGVRKVTNTIVSRTPMIAEPIIASSETDMIAENEDQAIDDDIMFESANEIPVIVTDTVTPSSEEPVQTIQSEDIPTQRQRCEDKITAMLANTGIDFQAAQSVLKPESNAVLDRIIAQIKTCPRSLVIVEGHADTSGDAYDNLLLSAERAHTVLTYLQDNGISMPMKHVGYGDQRPLVSNATAEGRAQNRRIVFRLRPEGEDRYTDVKKTDAIKVDTLDDILPPENDLIMPETQTPPTNIPAIIPTPSNED